jgi:hypothetical protein
MSRLIFFSFRGQVNIMHDEPIVDNWSGPEPEDDGGNAGGPGMMDEMFGGTGGSALNGGGGMDNLLGNPLAAVRPYIHTVSPSISC